MASTKGQHAQSPAAPRRSFSSRAKDWIALHRVVSAVLGGLATLLLPVLMAVVAVYLTRPAPPPPPPVEVPTVALAWAALEAGELNRAFRLSEALVLKGDLPSEDEGAPPLIMGDIAYRHAQDLDGDDRPRQLVLASSYLEKSHALGFPEGHEARGNLLLGIALAELGRYRDARPILEAALPLNPQRAVELHRWLAEACLNQPDPALSEALDHNRQWLADPKIDDNVRRQATLQRARIELALLNFDDCRKALDAIPADAAERDDAVLLMGRLKLAEARALRQNPGERPAGEVDAVVVEQCRQARDTFREVQGRRTTDSQLAADCSYLIGLAYLELGDQRAALGQFERTRERYAGLPAGVAASLEYADLLRRLGRDNEALRAYRQTLSQVESWETFRNPWISVDGLRNRLLASYQSWLDRQHFDIALGFTRVLAPVVDAPRAVQLAAQVEREWGQALLAQAAVAGAAESDKLLADGRRHLQVAGELGEKLAELRFATRDYPEDLWNAANDYHAGHDYVSSARVLEQYLELELPRRRPQALSRLGEALLTQDRPVPALAVLRECIENYPRVADSYGARLLAAQAWLDQGHPDDAVRLLMENLEGDFLTPASQEWRDSLFALGRLLFQTAKFQPAASRLDEAVARYPDDPRAAEADYLSAEANRELAHATKQQLETEATLQGRLARARERERQLQASLDRYERAIAALFRRQEHAALPPADRAVLRNCFFGRGSALFELARYPEAIKAYSSAANRYQQSPEVLEAYVQISECYRRLEQPLEARGTLEQAKVILNRLPEQVAVQETTNYTRDQWQRLLDAMSKL